MQSINHQKTFTEHHISQTNHRHVTAKTRLSVHTHYDENSTKRQKPVSV